MVEETQSENKTLSEPEAKKILGVSSSNIHTGNFRSDEFLPELKGRKAIQKFSEMKFCRGNRSGTGRDGADES